MANNSLENDGYVQRWLVGLSARTKQNYLREIPLWVSFVEMSPTEQINKRLKDLTSQNLTERTFFEDKFRAYNEMLEGQGKLRQFFETIDTMLTGIPHIRQPTQTTEQIVSNEGLEDSEFDKQQEQSNPYDPNEKDSDADIEDDGIIEEDLFGDL